MAAAFYPFSLEMAHISANASYRENSYLLVFVNTTGSTSRQPAGNTICAALDHGGGVRFGPQTFAIYSCAPLPPSFEQIRHNATLHAQMSEIAARICKTLPVFVDLQDTDVAELASLPVPLAVPRSQPMPPIDTNTINPRHLPWFLINAATFKRHCVVGRHTVVESLLIILQRPWCVLEICCCVDAQTIGAVREFALLAAPVDTKAYDVAVRLLSHEYRMRIKPVLDSTGISDSGGTNGMPCAPQCSEKALCGIYTATILVNSYNRFWLPLICCCAAYLDLSFSDVVRRVGDVSRGLNGGIGGIGGISWIELHGCLLRRIGDWI
ncbi:hypothetical protein BDW75DRAFT_238224 [Aspergillus navahoensis]